MVLVFHFVTLFRFQSPRCAWIGVNTILFTDQTVDKLSRSYFINKIFNLILMSV